MQDIIDTFRANGLKKIPTIHNDKGSNGQFSQRGLGKVDLYGWDGYRKYHRRQRAIAEKCIALGFDCDQPSVWNELSTGRSYRLWILLLFTCY